MTAQPTLFDPAPAGAVRHEDPVTSVAAARAQRGGARAAILDVLHREGRGLTDDEIAARCDGWHPPTIKSARSRLARESFLVATGERRSSATGHEMQVWALHPHYRPTDTVHDPLGRIA